jgi:acid stress-induced BolA-like protein IbaG/YrbA
MAIPAALENAIHNFAPRATVKVSLTNGHYTGTVIAPEFDQMTHLARQRAIWQQIREQLGAQATQIGMLLLYSPEEAEAAVEEP